MEQINELIKDGYVKLLGESLQEACNNWLEAWKILKEKAIADGVKDIEYFDENFKGYEKLSAWCQDLEMELENAAGENSEFWNKRINYCKEFMETLPETDEFTIMNMKLAIGESLFESGKVEEADKIFMETSKEYEDSVWPNLKWADCYWLSNIIATKREFLDLDKAEKLYKEALGRDEQDQFIIEGRLEELQETKEELNQ